MSETDIFCGELFGTGEYSPQNRTTIIDDYFMALIWKTDDFGTDRGFNISWESVEATRACDQNQFGSGTVTSPGFPGNYTNNEICIFTLNAEKGKTIKITFDFFAVEFGMGCMFDRLTIEGERYCGDELPSDGTIHIEKESAVLIWESDGVKVDRGFNFTWESISSSPSIEERSSFAFRNYQKNDENENLKNIVAKCDELEEKRTGF